jgi:hypothetical protein
VERRSNQQWICLNESVTALDSESREAIPIPPVESTSDHVHSMVYSYFYLALRCT